mmetsp:Transcript_15377/g.49093  ORF Transcript_15377/g.49093 Transcript_15377/m.49093 type:complete len:238 (-) Transcript_15377:361-1074(-)
MRRESSSSRFSMSPNALVSFSDSRVSNPFTSSSNSWSTSFLMLSASVLDTLPDSICSRFFSAFSSRSVSSSRVFSRCSSMSFRRSRCSAALPAGVRPASFSLDDASCEMRDMSDSAAFSSDRPASRDPPLPPSGADLTASSAFSTAAALSCSLRCWSGDRSRFSAAFSASLAAAAACTLYPDCVCCAALLIPCFCWASSWLRSTWFSYTRFRSLSKPDSKSSSSLAAALSTMPSPFS